MYEYPGYVVVLLSDSECEYFSGKPCVMSVIGPFKTQEEAAVERDKHPEWSAPHRMVIQPPVRDDDG